MKKVDKCSSAGTRDESSTKADISSVSQPIAKPDVVRSPKLLSARTEIFYTYVKDIRKMIKGLPGGTVIQTNVTLRENGDRFFISKVREKTQKDLAWEDIYKKGNR